MNHIWLDVDWNANLDHANEPEVNSWEQEPEPSPNVLSAKFRNRKIKTQSYFFVQDPVDETAIQPSIKPVDIVKPESETRNESGPRDKESTERTRISPPSDVIKLDDRLFYLLQPPLENLLGGKTLEFPFKPFSFQYAGIAFLFPRQHAILADEMGLGKTMQAITAIRLLLRTGHAKNILLICPKPLVTNWLREFETWAPEIPIAAISGNQSQRRWHWTCNTSPVKVANYELMTRDQAIIDEYKLNYDLVVLDEAQRIKNKSGATSKAIRKLERSRSWALTGTPIENSLDDIVGICDFVSPGTVSYGMTPRQVRRDVKDLVLRRTKDMVLTDMPPKLIRDAHLDLSSEQQDSYQQAEKDGVLKLNEMGDEITIKHVFELVLRLKQICNFDPSTGQSTKLERLKADMEEVVASGQKAIVFSQWVDAIKDVTKQIPDLNPLEFHGRIPSKRRDSVLAEFKENPDRHILLMSYGAGSVGLNLQFCRYVFLFDRWWNPAVEDQAINRAHRIGAAGSVTVTRMIMQGTIEQRIHDILEEKRELFRQVLSDNQAPAKAGLTKEEIFGLFKLRTPEGTIKKVA